jgi:hypothetical protein
MFTVSCMHFRTLRYREPKRVSGQAGPCLMATARVPGGLLVIGLSRDDAAAFSGPGTCLALVKLSATSQWPALSEICKQTLVPWMWPAGIQHGQIQPDIGRQDKCSMRCDAFWVMGEHDLALKICTSWRIVL